MDFSKLADEKDVYPAIFHFRVVTDATVDVTENIRVVLLPHNVVSPVAVGRSSSGGKYRVLQFSLRLIAREEHITINNQLKNIPGVKIVL